MKTIYSRVPVSALYVSLDGNTYADIPHDFDGRNVRILQAERPRMMRAAGPNGAIIVHESEAFIPFGRIGDALTIEGEIPATVTIR